MLKIKSLLAPWKTFSPPGGFCFADCWLCLAFLLVRFEKVVLLALSESNLESAGLLLFLGPIDQLSCHKAGF